MLFLHIKELTIFINGLKIYSTEVRLVYNPTGPMNDVCLSDWITHVWIFIVSRFSCVQLDLFCE